MGATVQYDWHSYPLIMLSMIGTILTLTRLTALRRHSQVQSIAIVALVLGLMATPIVADGMRTYRNLHVASLQLPVQADAAALAKLAALIPADAKLLTTSDLLVFFSKRRHLL
jgi:DMSO reductase anchor subunit